MSKITTKANFRAKGVVFVPGVIYTHEELEEMGFSASDLTRYYDTGWIDIEGQPPSPDEDPQRRVVLRPEPIKFTASAKTP